MNKNAYFLKKHNKVFYKNCPSLLLGYFMFMDTIKDIKLCKSLDFKSSNHLNDKEMQKKQLKMEDQEKTTVLVKQVSTLCC